MAASRSLSNRSINVNGNKGSMDIDSNSYSSNNNNTNSSLDILSSDIDYLNNNVNRTSHTKHKNRKKVDSRESQISDIFDGNENEISDIDAENPNEIEKINNNDIYDDSEDNEDNDEDNDDNDDIDEDNEDNDDIEDNEDNEDNENEDDDNDDNDDNDNEEDNEDNEEDSNNEDNNDDESDNSDNDNEDSNIVDDDENLQSNDDSEKEFESKLKLKIKIKRSSQGKTENRHDSSIKDKHNSLIENDTKRTLSLNSLKKEHKHNSHKLIITGISSEKESSNIKSSSEGDISNNSINNISRESSSGNIIYEEPLSISVPLSTTQKTPFKKTVSISKRKNKKSSIYSKTKKLKKPPKKFDLLESLNKVLKIIKGKDVYGIFLVPVDTKIVTDYASIIKHPMDFGTMQKKIDSKEYTKISEFQHDFELVIQNAKTYNAPETIYYRSADKISKIGSRLIEKEITTMKNVEEKRRLYYQELRKTSKSNANNTQATISNNIPEKVNDITKKHENAGIPQTKKKKPKRKRKESADITKYISDGSLNSQNIKYKVNIFDQYLDKFRQICPLAEQQYRFNIAYDEFETYGSNRRENFIPHYKSFKNSTRFHIPITDLSNLSNSNSINQNQISRDNHKVKLNFAYGDILGNTYVKSLERFTDDMSDSIKEFVFDYLDEITDGGHSLAKATEYLMDENPNIMENFIPPSKKIRLNTNSINSSNSSHNLIVKKEITTMNDVDNIPLKLTPYEIKQIENIINNIIIKKNYEYEQREIGLVESIIRDNHIDYLSVIEKEKISTIIKDIILKHNKMNIDVNNKNNKVVSDKLIKDYIESNIIELKLYQEMKTNSRVRDMKKEAQLEYNIQRRFLEMLNISTNYGIDRIHKINELQMKQLEQDILYRKKLEQESINKQQELQKQKIEQQKLDQEKIKQKEEALKKQLEQQKIKQQELLKQQQEQQKLKQQQQKQLKNRQEIGKQLEQQLKQQQLKQQQEQLLIKQKREQLLRQRLEQQKINANQPTQFDPKKDINKNLQGQQEKLLLLKRQQILKSLQLSDNKSPESQLKNKEILDQLKLKQSSAPGKVPSAPQQSPLLKDQDKPNSFGNISFGNLLNSRKSTSNVTQNLSLNGLKLNPAQQQILLQQQQQQQQQQKLKNYLQLQQGRKTQNPSTPLLNNSKLASNTKANSSQNNTTNSNLTSLITNPQLSVSSSNLASILTSKKKLNNSDTLVSSNLTTLISNNNKDLLSDKIKSNYTNLTSKTTPKVTTTQGTTHYTSLTSTNSKISNNKAKAPDYSSLLSSNPKLQGQLPTSSTSNNIKSVVSPPALDYSSLLQSNSTVVSTTNISSLLAVNNNNNNSSNNKNNNNKSNSPPSSAVGNKSQTSILKPNSNDIRTTTASTSSLSNEPDFSSLVGAATKISSIKPASTIPSLRVNAKVPVTQTSESSLASLISNNRNNSKIKPSTTQSGLDFSSLLGSNTKLTSISSTVLPTSQPSPVFSSLLLSKTKPQSIPSTTLPLTTTVTAGPDFSSLLDATIVPSTQSLTDLLGSQKIPITQPSSSTVNVISNKNLTHTSATNLTTLIGNSSSSPPNSGFNTLLGANKLATPDYSTLLGVSASNPSTTTKVPTEPDFSMLLANSGINSSSIVSSSISPYIIPSYNTSLPQTSLPLSILQNSSLMSALQTPSSQQHLTSAFLANNNPSKISGTNFKSNSKNPQLPTSTFPSYYFN